jgi:hypothetical protein
MLYKIIILIALPASAGRFNISHHSWDDPFRRFAAAAQSRPFRLVTPEIGEVVLLDDPQQTFPRWRETL